MASPNSEIKQSIAELKSFFDYHRDDFEYAHREINRHYHWDIAYKPELIYELAAKLYDYAFVALYPLLSSENPASDTEIINRVTWINNFVKGQTQLFSDIASHSEEGVLDMASGLVYELVQQLQYKMPEVLSLIKRETFQAASTPLVEADANSPRWVGIVTATIEEFKAVHDLLPETQWQLSGPSEFDSSTYYEGSFTREDQSFRVVLVRTNHQGMIAATNTTTKLLVHYQPVLVAMLGHAAGNENLPEAHLGNLFIASESVDYQQVEIVERTTAGSEQTVQEEKDRKLRIGINAGLKSQLEVIASQAGLLQQIASAYPYADLFPETVSARLGKFATGASLLRSRSRMKDILVANPGTIALDMEVQGFYYACEHSAYASKPLFVAIKSLSDYGGHNTKYPTAVKTPLVRQQFAAYMSAHFFYEFLFRGNWQLASSSND